MNPMYDLVALQSIDLEIDRLGETESHPSRIGGISPDA